MLSINDICKSFGSDKVLDNINLTIEEKIIVGLAGSSGSGKTTLLRCIQGLETPDSGEIILNKKSGFIFQDFQLFPHINVLENLIYAPKLHDAKTNNHASHAIEILKALGIEDKAKSFPCQLSGGQKQRVAVGRSLMMYPSLLLCDEPTSGLDIITVEDVVSLLKSVQNMGISTMIIASHDLDFLTKIADRIIVLKDGKIILDVLPKDITNPIDYLKSYYNSSRCSDLQKSDQQGL